MRGMLIRLIDNPMVKGLRIFAMFSLSFMFLMIGIAIAASPTRLAQTVDQTAINTEHRFTSLEVSVAEMRGDIKDMKEDFKDIRNYGLKITISIAVGLAGLLGEAGVRTLRKFKGKDDDDSGY